LPLEAKGIKGSALLEHMVGHILDLQQIWSTASDESLISLCRQYSGLYRYGILMEEAAEAESKKQRPLTVICLRCQNQLKQWSANCSLRSIA
jgi:hypothetical protein